MFEMNEMIMSRTIDFRVCCGKTIASLNEDIKKLYFNIDEERSIEPYGELKFMENEKIYVQSFIVVKR
jgi:hypothetical protein